MRQGQDPRSVDSAETPLDGVRFGSERASVDIHDAEAAEERNATGSGGARDSASAVASAIERLGEIMGGMYTLLALRAERRRLAVRHHILMGLTVVLVLVALVPLILAGVSLLVAGMAQGFAVLWGDRAWLGDLTSGVVILGGVVLLGRAGAASFARREQARKAAKLGDVLEGSGNARP